MRYRSPSYSPSPRSWRSRSPSYSPSPRRRHYRSPSYSPSPRRRHYRSPSYSPSPRRGHYRSPSYSPSPRRGRYRSPSYSRSPCRGRYRSPSYSPSPKRGHYHRRGPSSSPSVTPRGRYGGRPRESSTSLLVRNLHQDLRPDDLRRSFREFGPIKDIYLPRDYHTGEPRGFGFVQYFDPAHAADAKYYMDRQILHGREIGVVFAEESRKTPYEMRNKQRCTSGYGSYHSRSYERSVPRSHSLSCSRSISPRKRHHSRSVSPYDRRHRDGSSSCSFGSRSVRRRVSLSSSRSPTPEKYTSSKLKESATSFSRSRSYSQSSDRGGRYAYLEGEHHEHSRAFTPSSSKYQK